MPVVLCAWRACPRPCSALGVSVHARALLHAQVLFGTVGRSLLIENPPFPSGKGGSQSVFDLPTVSGETAPCLNYVRECRETFCRAYNAVFIFGKLRLLVYLRAEIKSDNFGGMLPPVIVRCYLGVFMCAEQAGVTGDHASHPCPLRAHVPVCP